MEIARNDSRSVSELWFDGDEITLISCYIAPGTREWLNSERKVPFAKGRFLSRKEGFFYERKISVGPREIFYVSSDTFETI